MISAIREMRRARGMTLAEVASACVPPTSAQMVGRLEMGTRTLSVAWLNRIAAALDVAAADLVRLPDRAELAVAALLDGEGARAPRHPATLAPPRPAAGEVGIVVVGGVGDYRAGDELWCAVLEPAAFAAALNRDVLVPRAGGRFTFGRLIGWGAGSGKLHLLPLAPGSRQQVLPAPAWLACPARLVRRL
jgi:transcriptional regulator with XRE-family HTH domain